MVVLYLSRDSTEVDDQIAARKRKRTAACIIRQEQQFEARRAQLQQRVTLIEQLRKGQTGPVHLLDQISRALPEVMWLTELQQTGSDVVIDGRCTR